MDGALEVSEQGSAPEARPGTCACLFAAGTGFIFAIEGGNRMKVVEKYYSTQELQLLVGFGEKWWRQRAQAGDLTLRDAAGNLVSQPLQLAGELRIPASAVNAYLERCPYVYDAGIAARNQGELRRKLAKKEAA